MTAGPFLTIFTRCCRRPKLLARNVRSVAEQSRADLVEQLFVVDRDGQGLRWANERFHAHRDLPRGEYVFHLDDDGALEDPGFVDGLERLATANDLPDVVLVKARQGRGKRKPTRILPPPHVWEIRWEAGARPEKWIGSGYNVVTKTEIWRAQVDAYFEGQGERWKTGGDWHFVTRLLSLPHVSVVRLNCVAAMGRRRRAREFEDVSGDWFGPVAARFGFEPVAGDVWRLKHAITD